MTQTPLLRIEEEYWTAGRLDPRLEPCWSIVAARTGRLQWACNACLREGHAIEGDPAIQTWCDSEPYFAFFDVNFRCRDCGQSFVFTGVEQRFWYEILKFIVQSRPVRCIACRRAQRARRRAASGGE